MNKDCNIELNHRAKTDGRIVSTLLGLSLLIHYRVRSGMYWFNAIELKKRKEANIQDAYDKIPSPKSVHLVHAAIFIRAISEYHYRKIVLDFRSSAVISKSTIEELIMLKKKNEEKTQGKKQLHELQNQRTVVVYGDANFLSMKGHSPASVKKTLQAIVQKALVVLINENNPPIKCMTEEGIVLCKTFVCPEKNTMIEKEQLKYPLKLCTSCSDDNKTLFTESFNIDSRYPSLCHNKN
ncbi:hypothetical protein K501DRAFT_273926 [Backusella circina FSU 941]|nr:hypothetical protein K501DRAFT_273926 [Backusella circina FSU 941]